MLAREEVGPGIVLDAVVTILDDVDGFGLRFCQSSGNSDKLILIHVKNSTKMMRHMRRCD